MIVENVPSAKVGTATKIERNYTGNKNTEIYKQILKCDPKGPLVVNVVKLYNKPDCLTFDALGRVFSGTIHKGKDIKILGEKYTLDDEEDMSVRNIQNLYIHEARYRVEINKVLAGNWVLIEGID